MALIKKGVKYKTRESNRLLVWIFLFSVMVVVLLMSISFVNKDFSEFFSKSKQLDHKNIDSTFESGVDEDEHLSDVPDGDSGDNVAVEDSYGHEDSPILFLDASPNHLHTPMDRIPYFCLNPTKISTKSGNWNDASVWNPAGVPGAGDRVQIDRVHNINYNLVSDASINCVAIYGSLIFSNNINTRLKVGDLQVFSSGYLEIGTEQNPISPSVIAELIIANKALDLALDPQQYGTGLMGLGKVRMHGQSKTSFMRLALEPKAGDSTLTLESPVENWNVGDKIFVPDTRLLLQADRDTTAYGSGEIIVPQFEDFIIQGVSADKKVITLNRPLTYTHPGARNAEGVLEFLPHVGNFNRNIIIRSESAIGTRGHTFFTNRSNTDIRYAWFKDLGRTNVDPLDDTVLDASGNPTHLGTNQRGRYALHSHHNMGPVVTDISYGGLSRQFVFLGNTIDGGMADHDFKWGIAIHGSHYGLIRGNVVYNYAGAGIVTEDGSETENIFERNFVSRTMVGQGGRALPGEGFPGREGSSYWFAGGNNRVIDNVAAEARVYGYTYFVLAGGQSVRLPLAQGDDMAQYGPTIDAQSVPILQFEGNEKYGPSSNGMTMWHIGQNCCGTTVGMKNSVIKNLRVWHNWNLGIWFYANRNITVDGFVSRGGYNTFLESGMIGIELEDYADRDFILRNIDIQNQKIGIESITSQAHAWDGIKDAGEPPITTILENSYLKNLINIQVTTPHAVSRPNAPQSKGYIDEDFIVRNVRFGRLKNTAEQTDIKMLYREGKNNRDYVVRDAVYVYDYNGDVDDDFRVYFPEQAPGFIVPVTGGEVYRGAPISGLTNNELWAQYGLAVAGAVAPCGSTQIPVATSAFKSGFVCPSNRPTVSNGFVVDISDDGVPQTPPAVNILSPTSSQTLVGTSAGIRYQVSGNTVGIDHATLKLDNDAEIIDTDFNNVFDKTYIFTNVAPGAHTVIVYLYDSNNVKFNNVEASDTVTFSLIAQSSCTDNDGDGYNQSSAGCGTVDCNDNSININPGAVEICTDGIDNNCNGNIDAQDLYCSAPIISITSPIDAELISSNSVTVRYSQTGNLVGVDHVHLKMDSQAEVRDLDNDGVYTFNNVAEGSHILMAYLADVNHNKIGVETFVNFAVSSEPSGSCLTNDATLVLNLPFDSGNAQDTSGKNNNGVVHGATYTSDGIVGGSYNFDGVNDYIDATSSSSLDFGGNDFTVSVWVDLTTGTSNFRSIIDKSTGDVTNVGTVGPKGWGIILFSGAYNFFYRTGTATTSSVAYTTFGPNVENAGPTLLTAVYENYGSYGVVSTYVNGVLQTVKSTVQAGSADTASALDIGRWGDLGRYVKGGIDEVMIFNRALTVDEIGQIYSGNYCSAVLCGNNVVESGEACDDGNTNNGDGCSSTCTVEVPACTLSNAYWLTTSAVQGQSVSLRVEGNNCNGKTLDFNVYEADDADPDENANINPTSVTFVNNLATGTWNAEWQCDGDFGGVCTYGDPEYYFIATIRNEGTTISSEGRASGSLDTMELSATCGNGITQGTEQCDDGNTINSDACTNSCTSAICGDNIVRNGFEVCDGNLRACTVNGYSGTQACNNQCNAFNTCIATESCGDGRINGNEICDDGANNGKANNCNLQCTGITASLCGNSITEAGEQCDDGNTIQTDSCLNSCVSALCGDNIVRQGVETCDNGVLNGQATYCNSQCTGITSPLCGNNVLESGEACDDGNTINSDACTNSCINAVCGDGITRIGIEECDAGAAGNSQCTSLCKLTMCGDGIIQSPNGIGVNEICDGGSMACSENGYNGIAGCNGLCTAFATCVLTETCGDGIIQSTAGESCDDSNNIDGDGCSRSCKLEVLGCDDIDGDGYGVGETLSCDSLEIDCNDNNVNIHPNAIEICNGIDDNCALGISDEITNTYYLDGDNDQYGNASSTIKACTAPLGYVPNGLDCNDNDVFVYQTIACSYNAISCGAYQLCAQECPVPPAEICGNNVDENCNGAIEQCSIANPVLLYLNPKNVTYKNQLIPLNFTAIGASNCWYVYDGVQFNSA
ncbi:MAG: LamG-like jellyroll fold domain-containing protein, partial [Nanoarchaeota archaeon]|nr:LamG-like jellyroll fold domain-containing protein [Nanoarchaeota archaeon]